MSQTSPDPERFSTASALAHMRDYLVRKFREKENVDRYSSYGYDLYVDNIFFLVFAPNSGGATDTNEEQAKQLAYPFLLEAAWLLCQRGVLRPGVRGYNVGETPHGSAGHGFSLTGFGHQWLKESDPDALAMTEPESMARLLQRAEAPLGSGFRQRAQEAVRCRASNAHLACCAMCGAAAECILLYLSVKVSKPVEEAEKELRTPVGRKSLSVFLTGKLDPTGRRQVGSAFELLYYWRDDASHAGETQIGFEDANVAMAELLRLATFAAALK